MAIIDSALRSCTVEVSIDPLNQGSIRVKAVKATGLGAEAVERCDFPGWGDLENRSFAARAAAARCTV